MSALQSFIEEINRLLADQRLDAAEEKVRALESSDPFRHAVGMATISAARGDAPAVLEHARRAHQSAPHQPVVLQLMAVAELLRGDALEAERYARSAVEKDSGVRSLGGLANILVRIGKPDEAEATFRAMLARDPANLQAMNGIATLLYRRQDFDGALSWFARAFAANPFDLSAIRSMMNLYAEAGRIMGALAAASVAREQDPSPELRMAIDMSMLQLTRLLLKDVHPNASIEESDEVVKHVVASALEQPARVRLSVAHALWEFRRPQPIRALLDGIDEAALTDSERGRLLYLRGLVAEHDQDWPSATDLYARAVEADGARWEACANALSLLLARDDAASHARAGQLLERVPAELKQRNPPLLVNEALYLQRIGRIDAARERLQRVIAIDGEDGTFGASARSLLAELPSC